MEKKTNDTKANAVVRDALEQTGMKHWQLADIAGCSASTMCLRLRHELPKEEQQRLLFLIKTNSNK